MSKNTKQTSSKVAHLAATTLNDNKSSGIAEKALQLHWFLKQTLANKLVKNWRK